MAQVYGRTYAEHVVKACIAIGKFLPKGAEVHHVNGNKTDNRNCNLVICQDAAYHKLLEVKARVLKAGGDPNTQRICSKCKQIKNIDRFCVSRRRVATGLSDRCKDCAKILNREFRLRYKTTACLRTNRSLKLPPDAVRNVMAICIPKDRKFGYAALARKYGYDARAVRQAVEGAAWLERVE